jgi:tricorn protease-like protein
MKRLMVLAIALSMVTGVSAFAQDTMKADNSKMAAAAALKTIKGTVKQDGDKITFVTDKDSKAWDVMNQETLKDHVGHHVVLSARFYPDTNSIHVMTVKMLKADKADTTSK